jgi:flagella basal body P-ring formation protein FlgA
MKMTRTLTRRTTRTTALLALGLSLALALPAAAAAPRRSVEVSGPRLLLSDLVVGAQDLDLGQAPRPGARRVIHRRHVLAALGQGQGRTPRLPRGWVVVTRSQRLTCSQLLAHVRRSLGHQLSTGLKVVGLSGCSRPLVLPAGPLIVAARLASKQRAGRVPVVLRIRAGSWPEQTVVLTTQIRGTIGVLVATRELSRGPIRQDDVRLEQRDAAALPSDALTGLGDLAGYKLGYRVGAGAVLRRANLTPIPLVRRGAAVTVTVTMHGIRVSSRGVARQDGVRGQTIAVLSRSSNRLIKARVVGSHRVVVDL